MADRATIIDMSTAGSTGGILDGEPGVAITPVSVGSVCEVAAFDGGEKKIAAAVKKTSKVAPPDVPGSSASADNTTIFALGPRRWMIVSDRAGLILALDDAIDRSTGAVVDLSHARCAFRLEGPRRADVLQKLIAVDFSDTAFEVGRAAQTQIHHMGVLVHRVTDDAFDIYAFSSYAQSVFDTVIDAALEFGYRIADPAPQADEGKAASE